MDYEKKLKLAKEALDSGSYDKETIEYIFPELAESEDERIWKGLIKYFKNFDSESLYTVGLNEEEILAWLERQGEQKETLCDKCKKDQPSHSCQDITALGRCAIEKQGEQKPFDYENATIVQKDFAPKDEPKFHEGEWITNGRYNRHIVGINIYWLYYMFEDGASKRIKDIDKKYHLWTIQDAKDGDVLAGKIDGDNYILIFKQVKDGWVETYGHYYDSVDRFCVPSQLFCRDYQGSFTPATKEQRDLLFAKMHEAGYMWDAEKKELKKM